MDTDHEQTSNTQCCDTVFNIQFRQHLTRMLLSHTEVRKRSSYLSDSRNVLRPARQRWNKNLLSSLTILNDPVDLHVQRVPSGEQTPSQLQIGVNSDDLKSQKLIPRFKFNKLFFFLITHFIINQDTEISPPWLKANARNTLTSCSYSYYRKDEGSKP